MQLHINHTVNTATCGISFLKDRINTYNPSFHHSSLFPSFLIFFKYCFSFFVSPSLTLIFFTSYIQSFILSFPHSILQSFDTFFFSFFLSFFFSFYLFFFLSFFLFLMISVLRAKCYLEHREKK